MGKSDQVWASLLAGLFGGAGQGFERGMYLGGRKKDREQRAEVEQERLQRERERHEWSRQDQEAQHRGSGDPLWDTWKQGGFSRKAAPVAREYLTQGGGDWKAALKLAERGGEELRQQFIDAGLTDRETEELTRAATGGQGFDSMMQMLMREGEDPTERERRMRLARTLYPQLALLPEVRAGLDYGAATGAPALAGMPPVPAGGTGVPAGGTGGTQAMSAEVAGRQAGVEGPEAARMPDPGVQAEDARAAAMGADQGPGTTMADRLQAGGIAYWHALAMNPNASLEQQAAAWAKLGDMVPIKGRMPLDVQTALYGAGMSEEDVVRGLPEMGPIPLPQQQQMTYGPANQVEGPQTPRQPIQAGLAGAQGPPGPQLGLGPEQMQGPFPGRPEAGGMALRGGLQGPPGPEFQPDPMMHMGALQGPYPGMPNQTPAGGAPLRGGLQGPPERLPAGPQLPMHEGIDRGGMGPIFPPQADDRAGLQEMAKAAAMKWMQRTGIRTGTDLVKASDDDKRLLLSAAQEYGVPPELVYEAARSMRSFRLTK